MALLDTEDIKKILPHRDPFLLVDQVLECDYKGRILATTSLTERSPCFAGHFPGRPIMPGVLQVEAMAQAAGILMNQVFKRQGAVAYFLTIDKAKFRKAVVPGDQLMIEVVFQKVRLGVCQVHGSIHVGGELVSEADLKFAYADSEE